MLCPHITASLTHPRIVELVEDVLLHADVEGAGVKVDGGRRGHVDARAAVAGRRALLARLHHPSLTFKYVIKCCFPPQFKMMHNWLLFHWAGCSCLINNQRPSQENSNCGEKQILHLIEKSHKIWVGRCNLGFQSIFWEYTSVRYYCKIIGSFRQAIKT